MNGLGAEGCGVMGPKSYSASTFSCSRRSIRSLRSEGSLESGVAFAWVAEGGDGKLDGIYLRQSSAGGDTSRKGLGNRGEEVAFFSPLSEEHSISRGRQWSVVMWKERMKT